MIYPDISLQDWLKKYPDLKVVERNCDFCGNIIRATVPFVSHDLVGLEAPRCSCGKNRLSCGMSITRTIEAFNEVAKIIG